MFTKILQIIIITLFNSILLSCYRESLSDRYDKKTLPTTEHSSIGVVIVTKKAVTPKPIYNQQEELKILETILEAGYGPNNARTYKFFEIRDEQFYGSIQNQLEKLDRSTIETIDINRGQAWIHKLTPLHWDIKLIHLFACKFNLAVPTQEPDLYPGTTLAHGVIATRSARKSSVMILQDQKRKNFLIWFLTKYPQILYQKSYNFYGPQTLENLCQKRFKDFLPELNTLMTKFKPNDL